MFAFALFWSQFEWPLEKLWKVLALPHWPHFSVLEAAA